MVDLDPWAETAPAGHELSDTTTIPNPIETATAYWSPSRRVGFSRCFGMASIPDINLSGDVVGRRLVPCPVIVKVDDVDPVNICGTHQKSLCTCQAYVAVHLANSGSSNWLTEGLPEYELARAEARKTKKADADLWMHRVCQIRPGPARVMTRKAIREMLAQSHIDDIDKSICGRESNPVLATELPQANRTASLPTSTAAQQDRASITGGPTSLELDMHDTDVWPGFNQEDLEQ
ncbi:hypothetical protein IAT40_002642 [Kwoniella sp. CBS 6097]